MIVIEPSVDPAGLEQQMREFVEERETLSSERLAVVDVDQGKSVVVASTPTVVDYIVYYAGKDGTVYGRDLLSGKKVFRLGE